MRHLIIGVCVSLCLGACSTRSISDPGSDGYYGYAPGIYKGELSEFDILGVYAGASPSDDDIALALARKNDRVRIARGSRLLLIQSGAMFPDQVMLEGISRHYSVVPFSGIPEQDKASNAHYARSLRFAAAQAGAETIIAYWGVLEAAQKGAVTKSVSWVPIVGWVIPDEAQDMRIRLKMAVIDVATGRWEILLPKSYDDSKVSSILTRRQADQDQIQRLKEIAYASAIEDLEQVFSR